MSLLRCRGLRVGRILALSATLLSGLEGQAFAQAKPPANAPALVAPRLLGEPEVLYPEGAKGDALVALLLTVAPDGTVAVVDVEFGEEPFASAARRAATSRCCPSSCGPSRTPFPRSRR